MRNNQKNGERSKTTTTAISFILRLHTVHGDTKRNKKILIYYFVFLVYFISYNTVDVCQQECYSLRSMTKDACLRASTRHGITLPALLFARDVCTQRFFDLSDCFNEIICRLSLSLRSFNLFSALLLYQMKRPASMPI